MFIGLALIGVGIWGSILETVKDSDTDPSSPTVTSEEPEMPKTLGFSHIKPMVVEQGSPTRVEVWGQGFKDRILVFTEGNPDLYFAEPRYESSELVTAIIPPDASGGDVPGDKRTYAVKLVQEGITIRASEALAVLYPIPTPTTTPTPSPTSTPTPRPTASPTPTTPPTPTALPSLTPTGIPAPTSVPGSGVTRYLVLTDNGTVSADLAESWAVSPDGLYWTFLLRRGVSMPDGNELNASVVREILEAKKVLITGYITSTVIETYTIRITIGFPSRRLLFNLADIALIKTS